MSSAATLTNTSAVQPIGLEGAVPTVFIDGEAGTTGLEIRERLAGASGLKLRSIDSELRKITPVAEVDVSGLSSG